MPKQEEGTEVREKESNKIREKRYNVPHLWFTLATRNRYLIPKNQHKALLKHFI